MAAVLTVIENEYGELPDVDKLTYGAINGVMFRLGDDYTYLRSPEEATFFNEGLNGSFEGIGALWPRQRKAACALSNPSRASPHGTPVSAAAISSSPLTAKTLPSFNSPRPSRSFAVRRGRRSRSPSSRLNRKRAISRSSVIVSKFLLSSTRFLDNGLAYLRLGEFSAPFMIRYVLLWMRCSPQIRAASTWRPTRQPRRLSSTSVDISSEFVLDGAILIERFKDGNEEIYEASGKGRALTIPLVVLVNEGSASALRSLPEPYRTVAAVC